MYHTHNTFTFHMANTTHAHLSIVFLVFIDFCPLIFTALEMAVLPMKESRAPSSLSLSFALVVVVLSSLLLLTWSREDQDSESDTCDFPRQHPNDPQLFLYTFDSVSSSQDVAKKLSEGGFAQGDGKIPLTPKSFVVTTREQTNGRGTNGRAWMGQRGNVFVTIGIQQKHWMESKIPLTLLPLKVGSIVADHVQRIVNSCHPGGQTKDAPLVTVKWPNDVLVDERKISGVLIESSSNGWFLVGIGVNLASAPVVDASGPNRGRPATSIMDLCPDKSTSASLDEETAERFGVELAYDLHSFLMEGGTGDQVLNEWKQWIDWDMELVLRDTPGQERVKITGVLPDGRIEVQHIDDGRIRTLVSDYFL